MTEQLHASLKWHEAWRAASIRVRTAAASRGDFARIPEIGRAALSRIPASGRDDVMGVLFEAYWSNRLDWDIRRLLEEDGGLAASASAALRSVLQDAGNATAVTVSRDQLALLLEDWQAAALHRRDCPSLAGGEARE